METINIVFSTDNNYAPYMGVAICSIFENKKEGYLIDVYVLDGGISEDNKVKLKVLEDRYDFKIIYVEIDQSIFKNFIIRSHLTIASYYRLSIPELINNVGKILYLDCDIIVVNDILSLYKTDINNYYFAAVEEENYNSTLKENIGIPKEERYCNSGVILINSKKWRENNTSRKLLNFTTENQHNFYCHDQDSINGYLCGKWLPVSYKYNYMILPSNNHLINIKNQKNDICIIHYLGAKPWNYLCNHPLKNRYFYYLDRTPWIRNKYINKNIKNIIIKYTEDIILFIFPDYIVNIIKKIKNSLNIRFY